MHYGGLEPNEAGGVYAATYKYDAYADGISSRTYSAVCERSGRHNLVSLVCITNTGSLHVHETLLRIDTGSLSTHCIQIHNFLAMIVVMVYYTYYESLHFSLFDDIFVILINLKL